MSRYFVSQSSGLDTNSGLTELLAWQTRSKVNGFTFTAGDEISSKRNDVWRESDVWSTSGTAGSPIRFTAYGVGRPPRLASDDTFSSWTEEGGTGGVFNASLETETDAFTTQFTGKDEGGSNALTVSSALGEFTHGAKGMKVAFNGTVRTGFAFKAIADQTTCYARVFVKFGANFNLGTNAQWVTFLGMRDNSSAAEMIRFSVQWMSGTNELRWLLGTNDTTLYTSPSGSFEIVRGQWYMIEAQFTQGTGANGIARCWVDGVMKGELLDRTWSTLAVDRIEVGSQGAIGTGTPTAGSTMHFDSLKLDTTQVGNFLWWATKATLPYSVARNGVELTNAATKGEVTPSQGEWWYDAGNTRTYVGEDPTGQVMEMGVRNIAVDSNSRDYVTIEDHWLTGAGGRDGCIWIRTGSNNITVRRLEIANCYQCVRTSLAPGNDCLIEYNYLHHYHGMGIAAFMSTSITGWVFRGNEIAWCLEGPQLYGTDHAQGILVRAAAPLVEYNWVHDIDAPFAERFSVHGCYYDACTDPVDRYNIYERCIGYGFKFSQCTGAASLVHHTICAVNGAGIGVLATDNAHIYHCVMYGNTNNNLSGFGWGLGVQTLSGDHSTGVVVKNCIIANNLWFNLGDHQIFVEANNTISESDYNLIWSSIVTTGDLITYQGDGKTWAEWRAMLFDLNSLNLDPQFVNAAASDFRLRRTSPAIGKAVDIPGINDGVVADRTRYKGLVPAHRRQRADMGAIDRRAA